MENQMKRLKIFVALLGLVSTESSGSPDEYFGGDVTDTYLDWVAQLNHPVSAFIPSAADPSTGAALHWRISKNQFLELGVAVKATGWLGFGLTVNGGMKGSDMVIIEARNRTVAKDAYVQDLLYPLLDDCQDWVLLNATTDSQFFMVQLRRKLDTGDNQDLPIRNDSDVSVPVSHVIAAWGDEATVTYHGPNVAKGALRWFGQGDLEEQTFEELMTVQADGSFYLGAKNHAILSKNKTEYAHFCFTAEDLEALGVPMEDGVTLIGFLPKINNTRHVHHFIMQANFVDSVNGTNSGNGTSPCQQDSAMGEIAYGWAPGEPPFVFPDTVGLKLGGGDGYRGFDLQIHYDNEAMAENQFDSSGVEIFYSATPRQYTAGYYIVGDPIVALLGEDIPRGLAEYSFDCPGNCSDMMLDEPVTVLREFLHMHQSGYSTSLEQIRNGTIIRRGSVEYYDFAQTGGPSTQQQPYEMRPGDSFRMKCYYQNDQDGRKFGFGSSEEMCMATLMYYPRKSLDLGGGMQASWMCGVGFEDLGWTACAATMTTNVLSSGASIPDRIFGTPSQSCEAESVDDIGRGSSAYVPTYRESWAVAMLVAAVSLLPDMLCS